MDITVHEVQKDLTLKELDKARCEDLGGTRVDQSFREMIEALVTPGILEMFILKNTADYTDMLREFETKKRCIKNAIHRKIFVKIPISLVELYEQETGNDYTDCVKRSKYKNELAWVGDKLRISEDCFKGFFKTVCDGIVDHIKQILHSKRVRGIDTILIVGGLSESPFLQQVVKDAFPQCRIIIPQEPGLAVLKGGVIFGSNLIWTCAQTRYNMNNSLH